MSAPANPPSTPVASHAPAPVKKKSRKRLWFILGAIALLVVLGLAAAAKNKSQEKPTMVTVEKAQVRNITHLVTATGKVQPEAEVKISPEVGGELIELPFGEGQQRAQPGPPDQGRAGLQAGQRPLREAADLGIRFHLGADQHRRRQGRL